MMPGKTCENCAAYSALTNECRRHAPRPLPVQHEGRTASIGIYPATVKDNWCCEWLAEEATSQLQ